MKTISTKLLKKKFNNKFLINKKSAFSLVEISIVVLILGLLIAGISKASDMILDSQLKADRALTNGAKVGRISSLILWLETTKLESLKDSERFDSNDVTEWKDITPPAIPKVIFKDKGSTSTTTYKESGFNNVPAIKFGAATDLLYSYDPKASESSSTASSNANIYTSQSKLSFLNDEITAFVVALPSNGFQIFSFCPITIGASPGFAITEGCDAATYKLIRASFASTNIKFDYSNVTHTVTSTATVPVVLSLVKNSTNLYVKINGGASSSPTAPSAVNLALASYNGSFRVGGGATGEMYELIIFNSALSDSDRQKVEAYLGTKYKIKVTATTL